MPEWLDRLIDNCPDATEQAWAEQVFIRLESIQEQGESWTTSFLPSQRRQLLEEMLWRDKRFNHIVYGGFPGAGRVRIKVWPKGINISEDLPGVNLLLVKYTDSEEYITERDLKGAVLAAGVTSEMLGDVIRQDGATGVYIHEEVAEKLEGYLNIIGSLQVKGEIISPDRDNDLTSEGKLIKGTVASPRLDSVLALGFGLSRSRASASVQGGQVQVNWQVVKDSSHKVKVGSTIIFRGTALLMEDIAGKTRKGRQHIILKKRNK